MPEQNPYQASGSSSLDGGTRGGEGSYAKLFVRFSRIAGPLVGVLAALGFFLFSVLKVISSAGQSTPSDLANGILLMVVLAIVVFGVVSVAATLVLLALGFVLGLIADLLFSPGVVSRSDSIPVEEASRLF